MSRSKKIIYLTLSAVFLALSAGGIGWLVKQEIEKGKLENQKQSPMISKRDNFQKKSQNDIPDQEIVIQSKNDAGKVLDDVENLMDSADEDNSAEIQINSE